MASKTNISDYRFSIFINNDQAKRSLIELEKTMVGYEANLKRLEVEGKKNTQEYRDQKSAIDKLELSMKDIRKEAGLQSLSLKELKSLQTQVRNEWARAIPGTPYRKQLETELHAITKRTNELQNGAKTTGMSMGKLADGFNKYFAIATAGIAAITGLAFSIKSLITAQGELDDSLANIRKSTGMTATEVRVLNSELGKIDTRTSRQDLRQMAVVAGQLGMAKEDVFAFVESVDKLNVALGDEFTGGAEEVAKQMGMLRNVLTDSKTANVADDMMRVGNAINTLGAAGFATGPVMADFASRIGGIGIPLGLTSDEVLGMSATLQELNVNAERGGTAVVKILQKMTTNTKAFAGVAGMPVKEFTNLVNTDLYGAFLKVIEGSNKGGQSATQLAGIIKELEISGVGASEIFAKLGTNTEMLADKTKLAGGALQETNSITDEFNIKNATLGATLAKLQKEFYSMITMPGVTEFFKNQVYHVVQLVNWIKDLPLIIEKYKIALIAIAGATAVWVSAKTLSIQKTILNNILLKEGILLKAKEAVATSYQAAMEEVLAAGKVKGTIATKLATVAQMLWNAALAANPIGLVIAGITALVGGIMLLEKNSKSAIALDQHKASLTVLLANSNKKLEESYQQISKEIQHLNRLSSIEKKDIEDKIQLKIKETEAELLLMQAKQKSIGKEAAKPTLWQDFKSRLGSPAKGKKDVEYYSWKNAQEAMEPYNEGIKELEQSLEKLKNTKIQLNEIINAEQIGDGILAKTQEALTEKLSKYQTALRNTIADSEDHNRIQLKIKETNKELAKFGTPGPGGSDSEKVKSRLEKLNDEIQKYLNQIQDQVDKDPKLAAITAEKIARLNKEKKAVEDLIKTYTELTDVEEDPDMAFERIAGFKPDTEPTRQETPDEEFDRISGGAFDNSSNTREETPDEEFDRITGGAFAKDNEVNKGALGVDVWGAKAEAVMNYANTALNAMMGVDQAMSAYENAQLQKDAFANEEKKNNLKRQLDAKKITQKQYDASIAKMDQEMDAKKRELQVKQAKRQKALSLAQAIISVAQAVVSALSAGPIIGVILAALVGILGAVQIGYIAATPIPEAAKGRYNRFLRTQQAAMGRYDVLGQDDKKQYRGVPYIPQPESGVYDTPTLFAETGREIILNPKHTENLMKFRPDLVQAIMQVPQRAGGLYPDAGAQYSAATQPAVVRFDQETLDVMRAHTEQLKKPSRSVIVYDDIIESMDTVAGIEKSVSR